MVSRLLDAGHSLVVYDTRPESVAALEDKGAKGTDSAAAVGAAADIVFCSLPNPPIVHQVVLGDSGIAAGGRVRTIVDLSTTGPGMAKTVAAALTAQKIAWVDAPVSGGIAGAKNGTLAVMISCSAEARATVEPILNAFGKIFYCGDQPGAAQVVKLGNNMIAAGVLLLSAEAVAMGVKAGIDPTVMCEIINASSGRNSATQDKFPRTMLPRTFDFGFPNELLYKDVKLCLDEGEALGVPMLVGNAVAQLLAVAKASQGPKADISTIVRCVEEWAGVEVKAV
jgi:3-hydroxyisobutyrate dehydrogenase-like beta-hydroxyacid dehydrogenase